MTRVKMTKLCAEAMEFPLSCDWNQREYILIGRGDGDLRPYWPLTDDTQAMALLCWLIRHNEHERLEISNHVFFYRHRAFSFTQLGEFSRGDHLRRAIVECVAKIQTAKTQVE